jgi:hypothetical protein
LDEAADEDSAVDDLVEEGLVDEEVARDEEELEISLKAVDNGVLRC